MGEKCLKRNGTIIEDRNKVFEYGLLCKSKVTHCFLCSPKKMLNVCCWKLKDQKRRKVTTHSDLYSCNGYIYKWMRWRYAPTQYICALHKRKLCVSVPKRYVNFFIWICTHQRRFGTIAIDRVACIDHS